MTNTLEVKYETLKRILAETGGVVIAFSGGVDSTLLLKAAGDVLGDRVWAVTGISDTTAGHELRDAERLAEAIGVKLVKVETEELKNPDFIRNPPDKCYICKKHRFGLIVDLAKASGFEYVADGENAEDVGDYRPGSRAARELGVISPLRDAGLTKAEIRQLSKSLSLPTWNKPAYACLATRIPYGMEITAEKLKQVDDAEDHIRRLNITNQVRVRHNGDTARIEVDSESVSRFMDESIRNGVVERLKDLGFQFITLDLEGYRMGSLNRLLEPDLRR